ncbi:hypothetical protein GCM10009836_39690 [Pseudonocardia ailaonensis]|uniref:Rhodanese domain-containing protein n=1 Tax=Pseudonocardia ailaonensis TaxID=367279 RepID=A0ABN2N8I3_9PSEU
MSQFGGNTGWQPQHHAAWAPAAAPAARFAADARPWYAQQNLRAEARRTDEAPAGNGTGVTFGSTADAAESAPVHPAANATPAQPPAAAPQLNSAPQFNAAPQVNAAPQFNSAPQVNAAQPAAVQPFSAAAQPPIAPQVRGQQVSGPHAVPQAPAPRPPALQAPAHQIPAHQVPAHQVPVQQFSGPQFSGPQAPTAPGRPAFAQAPWAPQTQAGWNAGGPPHPPVGPQFAATPGGPGKPGPSRNKIIGIAVAAVVAVGALAGGGYALLGGHGGGSATTSAASAAAPADGASTLVTGGAAVDNSCPFTADQVAALVGQPMVDKGTCLFGDGKGVAQLSVTVASATATQATLGYSRDKADSVYTSVTDIDGGYLAWKELGAEAVVVGPTRGFTVTMSSFSSMSASDGAGYEGALHAVVAALPKSEG